MLRRPDDQWLKILATRPTRPLTDGEPLKARQKNQEIEVLRAVAIGFTLFQHLCVLLFPPGPVRRFIAEGSAPFWGGVDLFFCISGYVISVGLYRQLQAARDQRYWHAVSAFWLRRVFRIVPSTWLWIAISLVGAVFYNRSGAFGLVWSDVVDSASAVLNVSNWHVFQCIQRSSVCGPNPIYWSLSLEEQFYLALPFIFLLPRRFIPGVLLALVVVQMPFDRLPWQPTFSGGLWFIRTDAIFLGVLIGIWQSSKTTEPFVPTMLTNPVLRTAVGAILVGSLAIIPKSLAVSFTTGLVALICAALVYIASFDRGYLVPDSPVRRILAWVGTRSFSLYLLHMPIYFFFRETFFRLSARPDVFRRLDPATPYDWRLCVCVVGVLVIMAELNFRYIEVPFRERGRRRSRLLQAQPVV